MCRKNAGHGRIEKRNCTVVSYGSIMEKMFKKKLVGLKSVVRIKSERKERKEIRDREICTHRLPPTRFTSHAAAL
jgi:hypothetical protein